MILALQTACCSNHRPQKKGEPIGSP